ncbi:hypothetical protein [Klenkia soli]|uniref:hypothetical protein n=1 Tax=Klenkia soli TaxID=1052260 RepID=UPI0010427CD9|nr:hypothetical protein [Klenkia soli]
MNPTAGRGTLPAPALPTSSAWLVSLAGHLVVQLRRPRAASSQPTVVAPPRAQLLLAATEGES